MRYIIILFCLSGLFTHGQQLYPPITIDSTAWTIENIRLDNAETFIYKISSTQTSDVELKAAAEIVMSPDAVAGSYVNEGQFHAVIAPEAMSVVSFHPNGWYNIPRYSKLELGIKLPATIQNQINAFLNGQPGLNPYDPDQVKVECVFNGGAHTRYGFYYRDYSVQNNAWVEQPTDYTFRIRLAPEVLYGYKADIKLYINGVVTETVTRYFGTDNSGNKGHLQLANGNLLKLQYSNGDVFFGIGQNVAYPIPDSIGLNCAGGPTGKCNTPYTFQKQRDYLIDLADNGGNFTRVRLDALNMLCEWPYRQELNTDPAPPNKPLSSYLTNYNDNQRYLWEYDRTFETMENKGIKTVLCLLQDQAFSVDGAYDPYHQYTWNNNPYSTITGNTLAGCKAFFTNPQSIATYRKWMYYVQARYGYSTCIAMWQIINETANVASSYAQKHAIDDHSFFIDVQNWVHDNKFILEQQYPSRPVTTGFVSDTNQLTQTYNLNVYSSNSYHGYTNQNKYEDPDYEARTNAMIETGSGYFDQYKPFFWGELGIGDSAVIMDKKSDRCFHNAVWASTFTGGISSGLYWNDWEQRYGVNHRKNFQALRAFTDMIDFSQRLEPGKNKDFGVGPLYNEREIHTWWLKNAAKNFIAGWTKNNSANVFQDLGNLTQSERDQVVLSTRIYEYTIAQYTCFSTNQNPETVIEGLLPLTNYRIKVYNTYDNANEEDVFTSSSNGNGKLSFRRTMPWYIDNPFNPDYAFIIKPASSWRMSTNGEITATDTIYTSTIDTVTLKSVFTKESKPYDYSWSGSVYDLNNKTDHVQVNYQKEGSYIVDMNARLTGDTSVSQRFYIVVSDKAITNDLNKVIVYPNPANNFVYLYYDAESLRNPKISCIDMLGKEYQFDQLEQFKYNTSMLPNGIFLIKFKNGDYEKIFKINVVH